MPADLPRLLDLLARCYEDSGRFGEAEPLYEEGLRMIAIRYGKRDPEVAQLANNLGGLYMILGRPAKAKDQYRRALTIAEANESFAEIIANYLNGLAAAHQAPGFFQ